MRRIKGGPINHVPDRSLAGAETRPHTDEQLSVGLGLTEFDQDVFRAFASHLHAIDYITKVFI